MHIRLRHTKIELTVTMAFMTLISGVFSIKATRIEAMNIFLVSPVIIPTRFLTKSKLKIRSSTDPRTDKQIYRYQMNVKSRGLRSALPELFNVTSKEHIREYPKI